MRARGAASALVAAVVLAATVACGGGGGTGGLSSSSLPTPGPASGTATGTATTDQAPTSVVDPRDSGTAVPRPGPSGVRTTTAGPAPRPTGVRTSPNGPGPGPAPGPGPTRSNPPAPPPTSGCGTAPGGSVGGKLPQKITFPKPANATWPGASTFKACSSSGLPVTYTVTDGGCTLVGADRGTANNAFADCSVTASQPGDARYAKAESVTSIYHIDPIVSSISLSNPTRQGGGGGPGEWSVTVKVSFNSSRDVEATVDVGPAKGGCAVSSSVDISRAGTLTREITVTATPCDLVANLTSAQVKPAESRAVTIPAQ